MSLLPDEGLGNRERVDPFWSFLFRRTPPLDRIVNFFIEVKRLSSFRA
jgi:hypothetical protein